MTIREKLQGAINEALKNLGAEGVSFSLEHPTELTHGEYATNAALASAKILGKNPREVAELLVSELEKITQKECLLLLDAPRVVEERGVAEGRGGISIAGPGFINFKLSYGFFASVNHEIISNGDEFGKNKNLAGQTWVIEHTSPNPNKAMHLGHLRNNLTGMAIANIAEANGVHVIRDCIDNNRGIAIAKLMWGYLKFGRLDNDQTKIDIVYWADHQSEWKTPESEDIRPDRFVDNYYVIGAEDFKNADVEQIVRDFVVKWESHDELIWKLWKKVLDYSYLGQELTLARLGNKWDFVWHEHEIYELGKNIVRTGLDQGIFKRSDGAIVTNLESYGLPDTVVEKADGTSLYITQELALDKLKKEKYKADKLFWVIGPEQSLWLKQVFAVNEQLGNGHLGDFVHIAYGYMSILKNGQIEKMSSRSGNVIYIDELIDMVKISAMAKLETNDDKLAEIVAIGAVKFAILFTGRLTDTAFDIDRATNLEGDSGPYLQYTHARITSMIEKAKKFLITPNYSAHVETIHDVEKLVYQFPEIVENALVDYAPNHIATYLIELARAFNSFYGANKIIDEADTETSAHRIAIASATQVVLKNGLKLLGIKAPEKM